MYIYVRIIKAGPGPYLRRYTYIVYFSLDNFLESAEVPESPFPHDIEDEAASVPERLQRIISPLPSLPCSLAEELEKEEEKNSTGQLLNGKDRFFEDHFRTNGSESGMELGPSNAYTEDELLGEDDMYFEEMLGVDPLMRTEVEMLQKEKESWSVTQKQLEGEKRELRTQKESFERLVSEHEFLNFCFFLVLLCASAC